MRNPRPTYQAWQPPHCPNPNCKYHNVSHYRWPYRKHGFYRRLAPPHRIQRFLCLHCRRSFSRQTFSTTYWLKKPHLLQKVFMRCVGCMAHRQIARDLRVAPSTIDRLVARLGRHCLLFHTWMLEAAAPSRDLVIDGLESFEWSQYYPCHLHLAVDRASGLFLGFTDSELRRKGRMTAPQKRRRLELERRYGRPDPQAIRKDMRQLLATVLPESGPVIVRSDEHPAYPRALQGLGAQIEHRVTSGKARRDRRNELWEVNLLELVIRHSSAQHKRETIAYAKRRQSAALQLGVFLVWKNYLKDRYEKRCRQTAGMLYGLTGQHWLPEQVLAERLFRTRIALPPRWAAYYDGVIRTRALAINRRHDLKYAY
jgi:transposase-like protein